MAKVYYTTDIIDPDELTTFAVVSDGGTLAIGTSYKNEKSIKMIDRHPERARSGQAPGDLYHRSRSRASDDAPLPLPLLPDRPHRGASRRSRISTFCRPATTGSGRSGAPTSSLLIRRRVGDIPAGGRFYLVDAHSGMLAMLGYILAAR